MNEPCLHTSLFVRAGWGNYYFGDYFDRRYSTIGFNAWYGTPVGSGFAIGVAFGNRPRYDPMWDYYRIQNLNNPAWAIGINNVYVGRFNGTDRTTAADARPADDRDQQHHECDQ